MKLFLIRPIDKKAAPWDTLYDCYFGFVIRAESEEEARSKCLCGDEFPSTSGDGHPKNPWLDSDLAFCVELTKDGEPGIIISDFNGG